MSSAYDGRIPSAQDVGRLLNKLYDQDPDLRYMALNDLQAMMQSGHPGFLQHDYTTAAKLIDGFLHTLNDTSAEVQNQTVKCLGPFVAKVPETIISPLIDRVSQVSTTNTVDNSIPALALRNIVVSLPKPVAGIPRNQYVVGAYTSVSKVLIPRLVGFNVVPPGKQGLPSVPKSLLEDDIAKGTDSTAIDVLIEVARCFGPMLQEPELVALQHTVMKIIQSDRAGPVLKKKAVTAVSTLAIYFSEQTLSNLVSGIIESMRDAHITRAKRKVYINVLGAMARSVPKKFGPYLKTLAPFVLSAVSQSELDEELEAWDGEEERDLEADEVREAALVALESFLGSCSQEMRVFTDEGIEAGTRFLKYDPNLATDDDEDMDDEEEDAEGLDDEDFEEEAQFDDEDDASWKVRRCAAKVLHTVIVTRSQGDLLEDGTLYERVAPALIPRFKEREESVRLEVLATLSSLVQQSKPEVLSTARANREASNLGLMGPPPSRKRRRVGSDASMFDLHTNASLYAGIASANGDSQPLSGPQESLAAMVPDIVKGALPLLKTGTLPTKQAIISLLKEIVITEGGGLSDYLDQIVDPLVEASKVTNSSTGGSSASSATGNTLRIEALVLLHAIAETHAPALLQPYLPKIVPALDTAAKERYSKVSAEALASVEGFIKAFTPPRASAGAAENKPYLEQLFDILVNRISANDADVEARRRAIHVLGLLIGRSSGTEDFLSQDKKKAGIELLGQRLKQETTRLASVRAIEIATGLAQNSAEFSPEWIQEVALELGAQLRKASRSLRGSSLIALRTIVINPVTRAHLDAKTTKEIEEMLLPPIKNTDLHLMGPALIILATFVSNDPSNVVNDQLVDALKEVVTSTITGSALDALLALVRAVAEKSAGGALMKSLLRDVGIAGNPDLIGKVIGTLLVYSKSGIDVKLEDFVQELQTAADEKRKCLALAVLGEGGLRLGQESPLDPKLFVARFKDGGQVPLAAAVALGRAGSSNVKTYLPFIISTLNQPDAKTYLLLHSIREILQYRSADADLLPFAQDLWQHILKASQQEDNRAVGAECIGRLTIIEPKTFLPQLQVITHCNQTSRHANATRKKFLGEADATARAMVISALRYTFADTDETYDDFLRPIVIPMLAAMLQETDLDNQRLALTTMSSAVHNKPELVLPHLTELLPLVMSQTQVKPELIREVQMGPFKHKVDDGLEVRKSAYETLYTLLETAVARLNLADFFERIIAGITDEHDVRTLCNLMLTKLVHLAPDETKQRLTTISEHFKAVISTKAKENAVKQEIEKIEKSAKGVIKVSIDINKSLNVGSVEGGSVEDPNHKAWQSYWEWVKKEHAAPLKTVEEESRAERDR
ncbi:putative cullin binding protein [Diplodia seriata]|uniref:Putative cullin binding protein n=1 Tax=Diplodia seriata TaxID=420778 RepID=A0A0G2DRG7_9PEZI|nr:putative cullin binding protein [Diplodia seriata]